jgi:hypothetical protein
MVGKHSDSIKINSHTHARESPESTAALVQVVHLSVMRKNQAGSKSESKREDPANFDAEIRVDPSP